MATNTLLTLDVVTKEAMRILHNNLGFAKGVNRQYDSQFAQSGAKAGQTIRVRLPARYYVSNGANLVAQNHTEEYANLTVDQQKHVGVNFTSVEAKMSLDYYSDRVLKPAMAKLASTIDAAGLAAANQVYNAVGTPGTTPVANASNNTYIEAMQKLKEFGCPDDDLRSVVLNPAAETPLQIRSQAIFNPQADMSSIYRKGIIGQAHGATFVMDQNVESITTGTRANGTIDGANQTGTTLAVTGADANGTVVVGDTFTIANVYAVNPENQASTGALQQFVVTAAANLDANGDANLSISPGIVLAAANVANGTVNALPANGAAITWIGNASTATPINLAHHRDAFILGMCDLEMPNVGEAYITQQDGLSMRVWKASDISTDSHNTRIDVLYGWKLVRPELACKIYG